MSFEFGRFRPGLTLLALAVLALYISPAVGQVNWDSAKWDSAVWDLVDTDNDGVEDGSEDRKSVV